MYFQEIGQKIKHLRIEKFGDKRGAQKRFAEFLDINYMTYRGYEDGNVTLEALKLIAEKTGASFLVGIDPTMPEVPERDKFYALIPHVKGRLSCGQGTVPPSEVKDWIWIPKKQLPGGGEGTRYAAVTVVGESMYPLLLDGETVIIDRTDCDLEKIKDESLYAVWKAEEDTVYVKRLSYNKASQTLSLVSFNRDARPSVELVTIDRNSNTPIMGKVVFSFRRWK